MNVFLAVMVLGVRMERGLEYILERTNKSLGSFRSNETIVIIPN